MSDHTLTQSDLNQFTGTEKWYRHWSNKKLLYTDGVQYLAECGGAYWLIDEILLNQQRPKIKKEEFQVWELSRVKTSDGHTTTQAILTCTDGNGGLVWGEAIGFTDFPLLKVKLYFTDNVLLLPSEY